MDLKKLGQTEIANLPELRKPTDLGKDIGKGPSFAETLGQMQPTDIKPAAGAPAAMAMDPVKFSNHAVERMMSRGIQFSKEDLGRLNEAVGRAASKGSKDSLILMKDSALIVSVKNKTVVTVMDKNALKDNVFTNIDSTIVME